MVEAAFKDTLHTLPGKYLSEGKRVLLPGWGVLFWTGCNRCNSHMEKILSPVLSDEKVQGSGKRGLGRDSLGVNFWGQQTH